MSGGAAHYEFGDVGPAPVDPGTTLLVTGPGRVPSRLAQALVLAGNVRGEGTVIISTTTTARSRLAQCRAAAPTLDTGRLGIVDATGSPDLPTGTEARTNAVSNTGDLTGISIRFSQLHSWLAGRGTDRIRVGFDTLSLLLLYTNLRTMIRFVHSLAGRVSATDGFGAFVLDPAMHDEGTVNTLAQLCTGRIRVRQGEEGTSEFRVEGVPDQPGDWTPLRL